MTWKLITMAAVVGLAGCSMMNSGSPQRASASGDTGRSAGMVSGAPGQAGECNNNQGREENAPVIAAWDVFVLGDVERVFGLPALGLQLLRLILIHVSLRSCVQTAPA